MYWSIILGVETLAVNSQFLLVVSFLLHIFCLLLMVQFYTAQCITCIFMRILGGCRWNMNFLYVHWATPVCICFWFKPKVSNVQVGVWHWRSPFCLSCISMKVYSFEKDCFAKIYCIYFVFYKINIQKLAFAPLVLRINSQFTDPSDPHYWYVT